MIRRPGVLKFQSRKDILEEPAPSRAVSLLWAVRLRMLSAVAIRFTRRYSPYGSEVTSFVRSPTTK